MDFMEYRIRTKRSDEWADKYKGAAVTPEMINLKVEGPCRVLKPNGKPLLVYLPGAAREIGDDLYEPFSKIRMTTNNRGLASGGERVKAEHRKRTTAPPVMSSILGSFDAVGPMQFCRLTAFTAQQVEQWQQLLPYFDRIAELFREHVPDRYAAQMAEVERTNPDWVIDGTPFTTITVNNTYPTGIHTDKGDLDAGFSTLGCIRRGEFTGGWLTFPQYGVAADMQNGDVLLMDAHEWHGNTPIICSENGESLRKPEYGCERISVVSYFRTDMVECGSLAEENERRLALQEKRAGAALGIDAEQGA